jgi:exodeoxyribonuclease III
VFLQECVDWKEKQLSCLAEELGLQHFHLTQCNPRGSGKRYNLATLSRSPFQQTLSHTPADLAHGLQEVKLAEFPWPFFNTHLVARGESDRLKEIRWFLDLDKQGLLAGDLNSLSSRDPYPSDTAEKLLRAGVNKYGERLAHDVLKELEKHGWQAPLPSPNGRQDGCHWATRWRLEPNPPLPTRTDYILGRNEVAQRIRKLWVVDLKNQESDHNPVVADLH